MKLIRLTILVSILLCAPHSFAKPLEAGLSTQTISITSSYAGQDLVLFGKREGRGDLIIVLEGPKTSVLVRKKSRVIGLWLNLNANHYDNVPGFYAIASSAPLNEIIDESTLRNNRIGIKYFQQFNNSISENFWDALVRAREKEGLFYKASSSVEFVGDQLFRAEFKLPSGAPVGSYTAKTYLIDNNEILSINNSELRVTKTGLGRAVYDYSRHQPVLYGLFAVIMALLSGWVAAAIFQRD